MNIDWDRVKQETLWTYEDLIRKLQDVLSYPFVREHYNHTVREAREYAAKVRRGYLQDRGEMTHHIDAAAACLADLELQWNGPYSDLVRLLGTRSACGTFLEETGLSFDCLIRLLNYLLRWVLPFKAPLREFADEESEDDPRLLEALKRQGLKSNLDLLESGRTLANRSALAGSAGVDASSLLTLVHRADISRLAYVRGKTVRHLCGGGYDTLEKIARANLAEMERAMDAYFQSLGKTSAAFKAVIPLAYMIGGAQTLPRVVAV